MGVQSRSTRWLSSLLVAAIGLHQLRYLLGPGSDPQHSLGVNAHAYLPLAGAIVVLLFGVSLIHFASALALARRGEIRPPRQLRLRPAWLGATLGLLAIFVVQESLEGALLTGHSSGLHGLFGHGGWTALLLAPLLGGLVALFLCGTQSAIAACARVARKKAPREQREHWPHLPDLGISRAGVLASHLAGRAPPVSIS